MRRGVTDLVFRSIADCHRTAAEQRYIWATLRIWQRLPPARREAIRSLIGRIARTPAEGRALYDVAVRASPPTTVSGRTGVPILRIYELRREFYERFEI